jgi:hypothetical protein
MNHLNVNYEDLIMKIRNYKPMNDQLIIQTIDIKSLVKEILPFINKNTAIDEYEEEIDKIIEILLKLDPKISDHLPMIGYAKHNKGFYYHVIVY